MNIPLRLTPIPNRIFFVAGALFFCAGATAHAQPTPWTEARVVEHARERAPLALVAEGAARRARARVEGVGLAPNPFVDWERQESFAPNAQSQDVARAHVPLNLSGRRSAQRLLAELDAEDASASATDLTLGLAAQALGLFYSALALERRLTLLRAGQDVLDEVSRVLASRQAAGEASGYERARLALEAELGRSQLAQASSELAITLEQLAALLGEADGSRQVRGDFEVAPPPPVDALLARARQNHPLLRSLETRLDLAQRARNASSTAWIPQFEIFGGYNHQGGAQEGHGYDVGLSLDLPFFDRGQGERAESEAALSSLETYGQAFRAAMRADISAARARLEAALAERERFAGATHADSEVLVRAARTGYSGGERSLVELLDARRAALQVAERKLKLDLAVRLADVALRQAVGAL